MTGGSGLDILSGLGGDDTLRGNGGPDTLNGGDGFDTAAYGFGFAGATFGLAGNAATVSGAEGRDSLFNVERLQFSDGAVSVSSITQVRAAYDSLFGRDPAAAELTYWTLQLQSGAQPLAQIERALATSGEGQGHLSQLVASDYAAFLGRAPDAGELAYWVNAIGSGALTPAQAQAVFAGQPGAAAHEVDAVAGLYGAVFGRSPAPAEAAYWAGQLASGATGPAQLRETLLDTAEGEAHTDAVVSGLYRDYFSHAASPAELTFWEGQVHVGLDAAGLRGILLDAPEGRAHTDATIAALYQTWFGRAPAANETAAWEGLIRGGYDFHQMRDILVNAPEGRAHTDAVVGAGYQSYFGRAATAGDIGAWEGLIASGRDFNQFTDVLQSSSEANGHVTRQEGTPAADRFAATGAFGHKVITGFTTASAADGGHPADHLVFSAPGFDPLAHAVQTDALDGIADVLITYDAADTVLLKGVSLAALDHADFLFG